MSTSEFWFERPRPLSDPEGVSNLAPVTPAATAAASEANILDAYSQAVVNVVETISPTVVSLTAPRGVNRGGQGSGFLITADGYALTNSHVVHGRERMLAITQEGDQLDVDVVGDDPATDLALVRLAARDLPFAPMGDSTTLRVGQLVIAMGNPLGFQSTVSTGVLSAVGRAMRGESGRLIEEVLQHTAPLNPGNSGGPLVDSRGRVIGINTAAVVMAQGLGFAVPVATARWVVGELLKHGWVRRASLGISATVVPVPRGLVRELDLLTDRAIAVVEVDPRGPAGESGLQPGDLIVAANERVVASIDDLHHMLSRLPVAQPVQFTVVRDENKLAVTVQPRHDQ